MRKCDSHSGSRDHDGILDPVPSSDQSAMSSMERNNHEALIEAAGAAAVAGNRGKNVGQNLLLAVLVHLSRGGRYN